MYRSQQQSGAHHHDDGKRGFRNDEHAAGVMADHAPRSPHGRLEGLRYHVRMRADHGGKPEQHPAHNADGKRREHDLRVMLASFAVCVMCGVLFGLASVIRPHSDMIAESLKPSMRGSRGMIRHHARRVFVIAETALAVIVVVGAGLLLRTVHNLKAVDAGFDRSRLVTFSISLPPATGLLDRVHAYQRLLNGLRGVPGVQLARGMTSLPLESPLSSYQTEIDNNTATSGPPIPSINYYQRVMSGFFETIGIPILQGRGFQSTDAVSGGIVAVVNERLASAYWKGRNPI